MNMMEKRLTLAQFEQVVLDMKLSDKTVEIAKAVLVEGKPQSDLVKATQLTKGAISQAVKKVWRTYELMALEGEEISVVLPPQKAYIVKQWAIEFANKSTTKK